MVEGDRGWEGDREIKNVRISADYLGAIGSLPVSDITAISDRHLKLEANHRFVKIWAELKILRGFMRSIEQLTEEILALPSASRALLAEKLIESLEFDIDPAIQAAWMAEAKKRRNEIRDGIVQPIPGEEALAQVRRFEQ